MQLTESKEPTRHFSTPRQALVQGLKDALGAPVLVLFAGMVGFGAMGQTHGFDAWMTGLTSLLMFALPGQVVMLEMLISGSSLLAIAFAVTLTSARFVTMVVTLFPQLHPQDRNRGLYVWVHLLAMTAWALGKRLVVLAGDTHNAWHSHLTLKGLTNPALAGIKVGEEFATSSVSSPGFEKYLSTIPPAQLKAIFEGVVDDLKWMDASQRGYLKMTFSATEAKGEWFFVNTITNRTYTTALGKTVTMTA
jgi:hypothetical protein